MPSAWLRLMSGFRMRPRPYLTRVSAKLDEAIEVIQAQGNRIEESKARLSEAQAGNR
jgi:hypothetical protein